MAKKTTTRKTPHRVKRPTAARVKRQQRQARRKVGDSRTGHRPDRTTGR